eukprot:TRINITY_DN9380_c0_g1_i1.p1 TRINITY_DN9380_c0_g1~~TRINITY_DN9380_c0_g1_i1.p1  ORF type:complete len:497 (-),score=51.54 TRINITY_DN9380_c0_g1_i1:340-1830(-)
MSKKSSTNSMKKVRLHQGNMCFQSTRLALDYISRDDQLMNEILQLSLFKDYRHLLDDEEVYERVEYENIDEQEFDDGEIQDFNEFSNNYDRFRDKFLRRDRSSRISFFIRYITFLEKERDEIFANDYAEEFEFVGKEFRADEFEAKPLEAVLREADIDDKFDYALRFFDEISYYVEESSLTSSDPIREYLTFKRNTAFLKITLKMLLRDVGVDEIRYKKELERLKRINALLILQNKVLKVLKKPLGEQSPTDIDSTGASKEFGGQRNPQSNGRSVTEERKKEEEHVATSIVSNQSTIPQVISATSGNGMVINTTMGIPISGTIMVTAQSSNLNTPSNHNDSGNHFSTASNHSTTTQSNGQASGHHSGTNSNASSTGNLRKNIQISTITQPLPAPATNFHSCDVCRREATDLRHLRCKRMNVCRQCMDEMAPEHVGCPSCSEELSRYELVRSVQLSFCFSGIFHFTLLSSLQLSLSLSLPLPYSSLSFTHHSTINLR